MHHVLLLVVVRRQNTVQCGARNYILSALRLGDDCVDIDDGLIVTGRLQERCVLVQTDLEALGFVKVRIIEVYCAGFPTIVL